MTVFARLLGALWALVVGWAAEVAEWLRKPGSLVKVFCAILSFGCLVSGLAAYEKEQRIIELSAQVVKVQQSWRADSARLQADVDDRDQRLADVAATLREEAEKLKALKAESAAILAALAGKIEAAERDAASWKDRYGERPDTCRAALELLDSACPDLKGY